MFQLLIPWLIYFKKNTVTTRTGEGRGERGEGRRERREGRRERGVEQNSLEAS